MITRISLAHVGHAGWFSRSLIHLLGAVLLCFTSNAHPARQFTQPGFYTINNLRVEKMSPDGMVATIAADFRYDGFGKPSLQVSSAAEWSGQKGDSPWFESQRITLPPGHGKFMLELRYLTNATGAPAQLGTDKITLKVTTVGVKEPLGVVAFKKDIAWGSVTLDAAPQADPGGEPAQATLINPPVNVAEASPLSPSLLKNSPLPPAKPEAVTTPALPDRSVIKENPPPPSLPVANQPSVPVENLRPAVASPQSQPGVPQITLAAAKIEAAGTLSATPPTIRPAWQDRFTLGAGDVLNFSLFGEPDLTRREVFIGPDGRVSYLEAHDVLATGLTVDELRAKFDAELGKYRRTPRTIITPSAYHSKKYYLLGRVTQKGAYTLDRPITIIEAVARARGFETGLAGHNIVELADLSHSFLARDGKRVPVDFEQLFQEGNLQQNIAIEPGDYLYFPSSNQREVYVLGEVMTPGAHSFVSGTTAVGAITGSGGFTDAAWKRKVIVVRGSLEKPEAFAVDVAAVLSAKIPDFKLQPRDIIYVSSRPWAKVEELLDTAATAFIQGAVITWTGGNIGPLIK